MNASTVTESELQRFVRFVGLEGPIPDVVARGTKDRPADARHWRVVFDDQDRRDMEAAGEG